MKTRSRQEIIKFLNSPDVAASAVIEASGYNERTIYGLRDGKVVMTPE